MAPRGTKSPTPSSTSHSTTVSTAVSNNNNPSSSRQFLTSNPPSHPIESDASHRNLFLQRSLDRCDTELAALQKLNASLHTSKRRIIKEYGEGTLLDLGEGILSLPLCSSDGAPLLDSSGSSRTADIEFTSTCRDFLLRLKLRRKLLNRLARRLNRASHAMDGNMVSPPPLPKYGDARFPTKCFDANNSDDNDDDEYGTSKDAQRTFHQTIIKRRETENRVMARNHLNQLEMEKHLLTTHTIDELSETPDTASSNTNNEQDDTLPPLDPLLTNADHQADLQALIEYDHDYDKIVTIASSAIAPVTSSATSVPSTPTASTTNNSAVLSKRYAINSEELHILLEKNEKDFEEFSTVPNRSLHLGVAGATPTTNNRIMSASEKVAEYKRWCNDLLGRIPDQPTFEELQHYYSHDDDNNGSGVFCLKERRLALLKQENEAKEQIESEKKELTGMEKRKQVLNELEEMMIEEVEEMSSSSEEEGESMEGSTTDILDSLDEEDEHDKKTTYGVDERNLTFQLNKGTVEAVNKTKNDAERYSEESDGDGSDENTEDDEIIMEEDKAIKKRTEVNNARSNDSSDDSSTSTESEREEVEERMPNNDMAITSPARTSTVKESVTSDKDTKDDNLLTPNVDSISNKKNEPTRKRRPFSLQPVPSFFAQDRDRTLMIHADILATSIHDFARNCIAEATNEYNRAFRTSTDLQNRKLKLEADYNKMQLTHRHNVSKLRNDYALDVAIAKAKWQRLKDTFDNEQRAKRQMTLQSYRKGVPSSVLAAIAMDDKSIVRRSLSDIVDRVVIMNTPKEYVRGTPWIKGVIISRVRQNSTIASVAGALGHVVDTVIKRVEAGWVTNAVLESVELKHFGEFVPPPFVSPETSIANSATGEKLVQAQERLEIDMRKEYTTVVKQLPIAEEERKKAWSRLLKVKADFEAPSTRGTGVRRGQMDPSQMQLIPAPPLKGAPGGRAPPLPAYVPPPSPLETTGAVQRAIFPNPTDSPGAGGTISNSKYSAEKVKARIYSDGSVMPVTLPKKNKDGLFQRPAGRKRKGMDWDAVTGRWVPAADGIGEGDGDW